MKKRKPRESIKLLPNEFKIVHNVPMPPKRRGQLAIPFRK